ncbi:twin transmembrane helix small protein [Pseudochrobactrum sp. sp1633]|uniref:twin transmembrane helix small protein n=1 Tax=Pseudochrobactrum sp. sp1633 TaxID=3036706 RepID=UPI0025A65193|nr:twin transmembrane helix small protein [Pseudochrobactrum sp. sp1633]MDM8345118.1 twin transmembrane helix small protein [Pseudochrobactrum sp. sp1633]HWD14950.1 twin transmembrane helix small protein [Pseudochrobactrum sp.]
MDGGFKFAAMIAIAAVVVVLFLGLRNMMRSGDGNTSNKLMRLRIMFQFIAVLLMVGALYFARK